MDERQSAEGRETWRIKEWLVKATQGCAAEHEKESLANWFLETCLYYAYLEEANEPQEIAVLATERLWRQVMDAKLCWQEESGLGGLLRYVRRAVQFEAGRSRRAYRRDCAVVAPLDAAAHLPAAENLEEAIVERLDWQTLTDAAQRAMQRLSPQQRLVTQLRMEGLQPREIAETLGIPRSQVNVVLSHAYARLRRTLLTQAESDPALAETLEQVLNVRLTEVVDAHEET